MKKQLFTIDGFKYPHIGYTEGKRWNGWATPYFEIDEALDVMKEFNISKPEDPIIYIEANDTFIHKVADDEIEIWKGTNYNTDDGIKHLYGIGAYSMTWELIIKQDIYVVAQQIEDFLWELDTYECRDQYNDREELVKKILAQLQDFKTLKQAISAFYGEELTEQELAEKLGGVLKL